MNRNELILEIQNRLNLVIVVAILFAGIIANLYQVAGNALKASQASLYLSADAGIYILTYLLFELLKKRMEVRTMKWLDSLLLVGIAAFIFPILIITLKQNAVISLWLGIPLVATLWALPFTAMASLVVMLVALVITSF